MSGVWSATDSETGRTRPIMYVVFVAARLNKPRTTYSVRDFDWRRKTRGIIGTQTDNSYNQDLPFFLCGLYFTRCTNCEAHTFAPCLSRTSAASTRPISDAMCSAVRPTRFLLLTHASSHFEHNSFNTCQSTRVHTHQYNIKLDAGM